jgi:biopolymer transport protein ExbB/TolQ
MFSGLFATGLLHTFGQSDLQGKIIVIILCIGSAYTWSVMLTKWQQVRRARNSGQQFLERFRRDRDPLHLFINNFEMDDCPFYSVYRMGAEEVSTQLGNVNRAGFANHKVAGGYKAFGPGAGPQLMQVTDVETETVTRGAVNLDTLRGSLGRAIDVEIMKLESQLSVLSTAVTGGPFLGLLGSAWGVMSVFAAMGTEGTMRLDKVAPGISAALLATVVGLLVAVPALVAYNWLATRVRHQSMELEGFAEEFVGAVEHNYVTNN